MTSTAEIAQHFVDLCDEGKFAEAGETYWADDVVSIEPMGDNPVLRGKAALRGKAQWWYDNHDVHEVQIEGPYVNGDTFAVMFEMDVTMKSSGDRVEMEEIALYTLRDGKIIEEKFLYNMG